MNAAALLRVNRQISAYIAAADNGNVSSAMTLCVTITLPVIHSRGVEMTLMPSRCSENASVSRVGKKIGNCHHSRVSGRCVVVQCRIAAVSNGSPLSCIAAVDACARTSRPIATVAAT
jgi:hypothetical protein